MKNNKGIILITTLIFLLILSLFAYQALEHELLERKLQQTLQREKTLYMSAKKGLESAESNMKDDCDTAEKCIRLKKLNGSNQYRITAKTTQGDMSVNLQSICKEIKINGKRNCQRLSWEQITNE